ncbi:MAG: ketopantoate reductase family protein [Alphaproteobacteria bacterium]|nr:ketopantoate reductase family protein [Alphaproteobacteria bacterium]
MDITVVGAGAMGGSYGGLLAAAGNRVRLIDTWQDHVDAINRDGLRVDGAHGEHRLRLAAATQPDANETADIVLLFTDTNGTADAARTIAGILSPAGFVVTSQNGIGNVETLEDVLGEGRVVGGSSMCSAATIGPGHVSLTHLGPTSVGEVRGGSSDRVDAFLAALEDAGFPSKPAPDIMAEIWQKFVVNCSANAVAAVTGLRSGEFVDIPDLMDYRVRVVEEVMAVLDAKGIALPDPELIKRICSGGRRMNRPSMLQHIRMGRKTEIDTLNGALVREAKALGIPVPYNEALVALLRGRELAQRRAVHEPDLDYEAWEASFTNADAA